MFECPIAGVKSFLAQFSSVEHLYFLIYFLFIHFLIRPVKQNIATWWNKLSFIQKYELKRTSRDEIRSKKQIFTLFLCALKYSPYIGADKSNCDAFSLWIGSVDCTLHIDNWMSEYGEGLNNDSNLVMKVSTKFFKPAYRRVNFLSLKFNIILVKVGRDYFCAIMCIYPQN